MKDPTKAKPHLICSCLFNTIILPQAKQQKEKETAWQGTG